MLSHFFESLGKVLLAAVLFIGIPLLGWGVTNVTGFASSGVRLAYAATVVVVQVLVEVLFPGAKTASEEGVETVPRQRVAVVLLQILSVGVFLVAGYTDRRGLFPLGMPSAGRYLGVCLFALGMLTVSWVEWVMGRQFSVQVTIQLEHRLLTTGPFRIIRHPRYLGIVIFTLGAAMVFNSWPAVVTVGLLLMVLMWRIRDEETLMDAHFGAE